MIRVIIEAETPAELAATAMKVAMGLQGGQAIRTPWMDGDRILPRELCERAEWSTRQLADRLGVTQATLPAKIRGWAYAARRHGLNLDDLLIRKRTHGGPPMNRSVTLYSLTEQGRALAGKP